jgi:hypothetical protein
MDERKKSLIFAALSDMTHIRAEKKLPDAP